MYAIRSYYVRRVPGVHFDDHPNDIAMRAHAVKQGSAVYNAVGAIKTIEVPPYPSTCLISIIFFSPFNRLF